MGGRCSAVHTLVVAAAEEWYMRSSRNDVSLEGSGAHNPLALDKESCG